MGFLANIKKIFNKEFTINKALDYVCDILDEGHKSGCLSDWELNEWGKLKSLITNAWASYHGKRALNTYDFVKENSIWGDASKLTKFYVFERISEEDSKVTVANFQNIVFEDSNFYFCLKDGKRYKFLETAFFLVDSAKKMIEEEIGKTIEVKPLSELKFTD